MCRSHGIGDIQGGENGGVPGVQRQGEEVVLLAEQTGETCMASLWNTLSPRTELILYNPAYRRTYTIYFL